MAASSCAHTAVHVFADHGAATLSSGAATEAAVREEIPIIDFSRLMSDDPEERSEMVQEVGKACKEWGCFRLLNHVLPESLKTKMLEAVAGFFDLPTEEKGEHMDKGLFDPVRYGTGLVTTANTICCEREFMRVIVHPAFHFPAKPVNSREIYEEYSRLIREISAELIRAAWESLGLSGDRIEETLMLKQGSQVLVNNFYPPSPQQEEPMGLPAHTDISIVSIVLQNEAAACLQVMHRGEWVLVKPSPNSLFVHTGDYLEIISNGIYKSVLHRVMNNNKTSSRISVVSLNGTPLEAVLAPLPQLVADRSAAFRGIMLKEYMELKQINFAERSSLDLLRL